LAAPYRSAIGPGLLVPKNPPEREGVEPTIEINIPQYLNHFS